MTLVETRDDRAIAGWPSRLRRTRLRTRVLVAVLALVMVAGGIAFGVFWHRSATYDPLEDVGFFGPRPDAPAGRTGHVNWIDGTNDLLLRGPVGTKQEFEVLLRNDGPHPVTITGIDRPSWLTGPVDPFSAVVWAPWHDASGGESIKGLASASRYGETSSGGLMNGLPSASRHLPAHLAAHGIIKLRFTVTKPVCHLDPPGHASWSPALRIHWDAMISSHVTTVEFGGPAFDIAIC